MQYSHEVAEPEFNFRIGQTTGSVAGNNITFIEYCQNVSGKGTSVGYKLNNNNIWSTSTVQGIGLHRSTTFNGAVDPFIAATRNNNAPLILNRLASDGGLVELRQAGIIEGTISVVGTTVSYNGGHLSRWSQLPGLGSKIDIPKGTVMSGIEEMCEWYYIEETSVGEDGNENINHISVDRDHPGAIMEENEQLTRCQVSTVENDKSVCGVFVGWDEDDDENTQDFYIAQTGDFIIRVTGPVNKGDLLTSAGNGTAKVQSDDLVHSYTVAKAMKSFPYAGPTQVNVVPCVLMIC
jgi:hypothetical protein